jgi:lipopolysaccharide export LptBFGC system permease protein LptF
VFVYWIFHSFGASASESGLLPPLVGAWMPNMALLLAAAGAYMKRAV